MGNTSITVKVALWFLTALTSLAGYVAFQQKQQIKTLEETISRNDRNYKEELVYYKDDAKNSRREKDSIQALILSRTDNGYLELKKLLRVNDSNNSTITITPKKK